MTYMLVRNKVGDFDVWKKVFDEGHDAAREAGLDLVHLWRSTENPNEVFFLLSVSDIDRARAFTADPALCALATNPTPGTSRYRIPSCPGAVVSTRKNL